MKIIIGIGLFLLIETILLIIWVFCKVASNKFRNKDCYHKKNDDGNENSENEEKGSLF